MDLEIDLSSTESNDDWFRSRRLLLDGTQKSLGELERMDNTEMVEIEELGLEEEIINYQIYDVNGMVGEFVTTSELIDFRDFIDDLEDNEKIKEFIDKGASLLTEGFVNEVNRLKSPDKNIQRTIEIFQGLVDKADTIVIINDGLKED